MARSSTKIADRSNRGDPLYTRQEAADYLNVTLRFVTRCIQERRIRYVRVGRLVRIPESALSAYVELNTTLEKQS